METINSYKFEISNPCQIVKSVMGEDGEWLIHGTVASEKPDYDGETIDRNAIKKGLQMFKKLGCNIDWEHQFKKTLDTKYLIGKAIEFYDDEEGKPCIVGKLFKNKEFAKSLWEHLQNPDAECGFSIEGVINERHPKDKKKIIDLEIHRVTVSHAPKGFDNRVRKGVPQSLAELCKAVSENPDELFKALSPECECKEKEIPEDKKMTKAEAHYRPDVSEWKCATCKFYEKPDCHKVQGTVSPDAVCDYWEDDDTDKALTTGSGVVTPGTTGGAVLRTQELKGRLSPSSYDGKEPIKKKPSKKKKLAEKPEEESKIYKKLVEKGFPNPEKILEQIKNKLGV